MTRITTLLVVFFVALNVFAGVLVSTGAAATLGIDAEVGQDGETEQVTNQAQGDSKVPAGSPTGGTLFGMYNVVAGFFGGIYEFLFPGLVMLERVGVPSFVTRIFGALFSVFILVDTASILRGFDV